MSSNNNGRYVIRTKMSEALIAAVRERASKGRMTKGLNHLARVVLTNEAKGVGVKFDSNRRKPKVAAETAVKEVA